MNIIVIRPNTEHIRIKKKLIVTDGWNREPLILNITMQVTSTRTLMAGIKMIIQLIVKVEPRLE